MENLLNTMLTLDKAIFFFINKTLKNHSLDTIFPFITRLAEPPAIIILCILMFILGRYKEKFVSVFILFTGYISYFLAMVIKEAVNRPRPLELYTGISVIGKTQSPAFPSVHSTLIAVVITILCFKYKKLGFALIPIALLVGISRIYLGHHYPTDVIAGLLIGSLLSMLFLGIEKFFQSLRDL
ncbi:MAG: phosphatase PAP2 family protein [Candidatus Omnitrophica bacterium]|nr:phosphatase PAP2 family protein [Candidatus Omnitrophota bacterium]MBM3713515.1 phosphatase PAP2 family protein [Actinomycetota bacterium]